MLKINHYNYQERMLLISIILNIITILIVGGFILVVYMSYRTRPNLKATPLDVMRDIVGGQSGHARVYKAAHLKELLTGPVGTHEEGMATEGMIYSDIDGNSYSYDAGKRPWDGVEDINFGSSTGVSSGDLEQMRVQEGGPDWRTKGDAAYNEKDWGQNVYISEGDERREILQTLEDSGTLSLSQLNLLDSINPNDPNFESKIELLKKLDNPTDPNYAMNVNIIKSS